MNKRINFRHTVVGAIVVTMGLPPASWAAPLNLVQYPAGSANKQPTPNVIVTVDNSGSMGTAGINALQTALKDTFDPANLADGSIRLAYQTMWGCNTIPSSDASCSQGGVSWNTMRELKGSKTTSESSHRGQFYRWVDTLSPGGNTPTHFMMWNAGEYLKTTGINNPWNAEPGTADSNPLTCRRAYHILMTDGGWNQYPHSSQPTFMTSINIGNADGTNKTFPDGQAYSTTNAETQIYKDSWGSGTTSIKIGGVWYTPPFPTISDMAFHYWSTDLQSSINNEVVPLIKKSGTETFGTGASAQNISQYWNPKNDPANWQHMTTFTIGYENAASWPNITTNPMFTVADGMYGGDFAKAITGEKYWRDPITTNETDSQEELWHAAINSRGKFYPAQTSQDLKNAFMEIVGNIVADNTKPITSFASSSTNNTRSDIGEFISGYDANGWKGYVRSDVIAKVTGARSANPAWGVKTGFSPPNDRETTADKLDALATVTSRLILSTNDTNNAGVSFEWETGTTKLSAAQKTLLDAGSIGEDRLNFIRGDRSKEGNTTGKPFRARLSRQGDIVNSNTWYVGSPASNYALPGYLAFTKTNKTRIPMIYVGGNDGMLHGFSAINGTEKIAFIPKGVIANLPSLSDPSYSHRYYVDGSPFTGDVNWGSSPAHDWRTLLVGTLGAGGRGYFLLDVTKPGTTDASISSNFSAGNASDLVVLDNTWHNTDALALDTTKPEADLGHIFANPVLDDINPYKATQITRMNNGKWAVVLGNGYNSTNERPVLLIQFVDKATNDMSLKRIVAATSGDDAQENGLSAPRLVDINGDGTPDVVYAGDLKGNLWKFDLSSSNSGDWGVAFSGNPLYKAAYTSGASSTKQPITAPPTVKANDRGAGGMMVAFGTGRNITEADRTDTTSKQTIYSVLDNTVYKLVSGKVTIDTAFTPTTAGTGTSNLVEQTMVATSIAGAGASSGRTFWKMSQNPVNYTGAGAKKGWYFTLPEPGERLLKPIAFYDGSNNLEVLSQIPASGGNSAEELCNPSPQQEKQFRTFLNIMDGKRPGVQVMDANGDGLYINSAGEDQGVSRMSTSGGAISNTTGKNASGNIRNVATGADGKQDIFAPMPEQPMRPSWRQLQ